MTNNNSNYIISILLVLLLFFVVLFFYIKLKYPFWNGQPVYHIYDYWRAGFIEPSIIQKDYPKITKYCNFADITTIAYQDMTENQIRECVDLIQTQYINTEDTVYVFNSRTLDSYMTGHNYSSYISVFLEPKLSISSSIGQDIKKELIPKGMISSRSILINGSEPAYYWDFICKHRNILQKSAYQLIQTHYYRTRVLTPEIKIALFKKEGNEVADYPVVPLVTFTCVSYKILPFIKPPTLPKYYIVVDINRTNIALVMEFLLFAKDDYTFWAMADIGNIEGMILSGLLYGYALFYRGSIAALYFFRDSRIYIENPYEYEDEKGSGSLLELVASINHTGSRDLFYDGFLHALFLLIKYFPVYRILKIEGLGDNSVLNLPDNKMIKSIPGAYYFYNYFYRTVSSNLCFIFI
jgi:hypothetical protein